MKKKIGVITLFGYHNYGNRLQNYATQRILEKMNFEVETIKNIKLNKKIPLSNRIKNYQYNLKNILISKFKTIKNKKINNIRKQKFIDFSKKYINETNYIISVNSVPKNLANEFDFFIVGSDQVWHPSFSGSDIEFLAFAPPGKRISFSASFGVSEIPKEKKDYYRKKLTEMASISVREESGAQIVKELSGKNSTVLVDPTMLLNKTEWLEIIDSKISMRNKEYIYIYFLGSITTEYKDWINNISKEYNLEIIDALDIRNRKIYTSDPAEFVSLINNAKLVCTDSFHASVFSILMETNFIVFDRIENNKAIMGSRIETLLKKFQLLSRKWNKYMSLEEIFKLDFSDTKKILELEKKKAISFLEDSLKINK